MSHYHRQLSLVGALTPPALPDSSVKDAGCGYIHFVDATGYFILICATGEGFYYKEYDKDMQPTTNNWTHFADKVGADNVTQVIGDRLILAQMTVWGSGTSEWKKLLQDWTEANLAPQDGKRGYLSWFSGWKQVFGWKVESFKLLPGTRAPFTRFQPKKEVLIPIVASDGTLEKKYKLFRAENGLPALKPNELAQYLEAESGGPMIHRVNDDPSDLTFAITTDYLKNGFLDGENPVTSGLGGLGTHHWLLDIDLDYVDPYQVIITSNSDSTKSPKETVPHYGFVTHLKDEYLWREAPPRACELSIVPSNNKLHMIASDWNWGNLIALEFDPDWNFKKPGAKSNLPFLELDSDVERSNFPTGAVWDKDGEQFIVAYIDTTKRKDLGGGLIDWQNIRLARYDQDWNLLDDIAITTGMPNDKPIPDPITGKQYFLLPCIPWLVQSGTRIYVSFHDRKVFVWKKQTYLYEVDKVPYGGNVYVYDLVDLPISQVQKPFLGVLPVKDEPGARLENRIPLEELTTLMLQEAGPLAGKGVTHIDRKAKTTVMTRDAATHRSLQQTGRKLNVITQKPRSKT
jgi:hypothetical protein